MHLQISYIHDTIPILPIPTLVFYYGTEKWDGNIDLYDMFPKEMNPILKQQLKKWVPNYWINLIDGNNIENIHQFQTDLKIIFGLLQNRSSKQNLKDYLDKNTDYFSNMDIDTYLAVLLKLFRNLIKPESMPFPK